MGVHLCGVVLLVLVLVMYSQFMEQVQFFAAGLVKLGMAARGDLLLFLSLSLSLWCFALLCVSCPPHNDWCVK